MTTRSTASSTRIEQAVAETQGMFWLLDDVLQAKDDLLALLAKPTELPMEQRERLLIFCDRISTTCKKSLPIRLHQRTSSAAAELIQYLTPQPQEQPAPSGLAFSVSRGARASQVRRLLVAGGGG
jgi:hypothetical protein